MKESLIDTEELLALKNKAKALEGVAYILDKIKSKSLELGYEGIVSDSIFGLVLIDHLTRSQDVPETGGKEVGWDLYKFVDPDLNSVEYLPTGEVFCIGDKVKKPDGKVFKITDFYWDCSREHMLCGPEHIGVRKVKLAKVIGTTEDGVPLYGGEVLHEVHLLDYKFRSVKIGDTFSKSKHNKYFFDKEKAKIYVLNNKPTFSLQEVLSSTWANICIGKDMEQIEEDFTNEAKTKI